MDDWKPLFTQQEIQSRIKQLAKKITGDYKDKDFIAICVLKGSFLFFADLIRLIDLPVTVDFIVASSYIKNQSSGRIQIDYQMKEVLTDKDVLIIEDIVDTGLTINHITETIAEQKPKSLKVCTLLDKKERRQVKVNLDYVGFDVPDLFVVGYGMDYENQFRNIPFIAVVDDALKRLKN